MSPVLPVLSDPPGAPSVGVASVLRNLALLLLPFAALIFLAGSLVGLDGYFHIKFAYLMRVRGFLDALPWLEWTIHRDAYRDHHFLQHILYIPFTFGDLETGARWAALLSVAAAGAVFLLLLRQMGVVDLLPWALLFSGTCGGFLHRLSMPRVQSLSVAFLLGGILLWKEGRLAALGLLAAAYVWLYDGFVLLPIVLLVFVLASPRTEMRAAARRGSAALAGMLAGMVVNPFFPENVQAFFMNVGRVVAYPGLVERGTEWDPPALLMLTASGLPLLGIVVLCLVQAARHGVPAGPARALGIMAAVFLLLTFRYQRFVEYAAPFLLLYAALTLPPLWTHHPGRRRAFLVAAGIAWIATGAGTLSWHRSQEGRPAEVRGAARWLRENTPEGTLVFNTAWDDFPMFFFENHHNHLVVGLDPAYLHLRDPERFRLYAAVRDGRDPDPLATIRDRFGAEYVLLDSRRTELWEQIRNDPRWTLEYGGHGSRRLVGRIAPR